MPLPGNEGKSSEEQKQLISFQFPDQHEAEMYMIELEDGSVVFRTKEEIEKQKKV